VRNELDQRLIFLVSVTWFSRLLPPSEPLGAKHQKINFLKISKNFDYVFKEGGRLGGGII
jgi:hypothetical protein